MRYLTSASRYHPRYQSRSSMYIRGQIPQNFAELAEAVPIDFCSKIINVRRWLLYFGCTCCGEWLCLCSGVVIKHQQILARRNEINLAAVHSKAVILLTLLIHCLCLLFMLLVPLFVGNCLFGEELGVLFSFAVISYLERASCYTFLISCDGWFLCVYLAVPWVGVQCDIVVLLGHTSFWVHP